jgi:hypothetical protein
MMAFAVHVKIALFGFTGNTFSLVAREREAKPCLLRTDI